MFEDDVAGVVCKIKNREIARVSDRIGALARLCDSDSPFVFAVKVKTISAMPSGVLAVSAPPLSPRPSQTGRLQFAIRSSTYKPRLGALVETLNKRQSFIILIHLRQDER